MVGRSELALGAVTYSGGVPTLLPAAAGARGPTASPAAAGQIVHSAPLQPVPAGPLSPGQSYPGEASEPTTTMYLETMAGSYVSAN